MGGCPELIAPVLREDGRRGWSCRTPGRHRPWRCSGRLAVALGCVLAQAAAAEPLPTSQPLRKGVLLLHSYHEGLTWTDGVDQGIRTTLAARPDIEIYTEYLDSKRITREGLPAATADYLAQKYAETPLAVIIVSDNSALAFLARYQKAVFGSTPVVFCGIDDFTPDLLAGLAGPVTGVVQALDPRQTVELIRTLQPDLQRLVVVSGTDVTALAMRRQAQAALANEARGLDVVWLDGPSARALQERLSGLSRADAVLLCNFNRDAEGAYLSHEDSARLICAASGAPVYAMQDLYLGTGVVGGSVITARDQGAMAARLGLEILAGRDVPPISLECPHAILCDFAVLQKFGLDLSRLPPTATLINHPLTFYERYRRLIWTAAGAFALLLLALAGVSFGLVRSRSAARQLRRSEEKLRTTLNSIGDAVIATDVIGRIIHMNPVAERLTGWTAAEAVHQPLASVLRIVNAVTRQPVDAPVEEVLRRGQIVGLANHTTLLARDGAEYQIADSAAPIRAEGAQITGVVLVFRDVTEDYRMRRRLAESEAQMKLALQGADLCTWDWNVPARQVAFNERWAEMLGYPSAERAAPFDIWMELVHPDDRPSVQQTLEAHLQGQTAAYETEHRLRHKTGAWVWVLGKGRVIERNADGAALRMCGTYLDITQRRRAEAEHAKLEAQLRQAQKMESIGLLAGGIAHDFNNILTAISGSAEAATQELQTRFPAAAGPLEWLQQVERSVQRAAALTRQLLAFGRRQLVRPQVLDLNTTLRELEKMLRRLLTENLSLQLRCAPELPAVQADPGQLEQVIVNLVVNARDAMSAGGQLTLETRPVPPAEAQAVLPPDARPGAYVMLAVSDTGCGMDAATREHIFEPFFTTKPLGQGTGLGLSTVYGIVKQAGGHVAVYSEPGQGTTFKVYLPARPEDSRRPQPAEVSPTALGGSDTIVVCEDDVAVRKVTAQMLQDAGYTVLVAEDAADALRRAAAHPGPIDLLVTDVIMPGMNGRQLAEALSALRPALRTLFVSGYTSSVIAHCGVLERDVEFLEKPFSRQQLLQRVRDVLSQPHADVPPAQARVQAGGG